MSSLSVSEIHKRVRNDIYDACAAVQLAQRAYLVTKKDAEVIDHTNFSNALIIIRDSLIHRCILSLNRVLDDNSLDRITLEKLIRESPIPNERRKKLLNKLVHIKGSIQAKDLREVRVGRIAHSLINRGPQLLLDNIHQLKKDTLELFNAISEEIDQPVLILSEINKFWNFTSQDLWGTILRDPYSLAKGATEIDML